ncbi:hypothetical protein BZL29_7673 [Mycobacterium kansasii]|uniref:Uncharacterized protein n=1 Tax=Mycobacterium kansasii TaxID=1768 RepID=A0A1V3WGB6_MYCKA|nr:hypothetical protein BZL29_7673 [Mycobacterium kansasii]
MFWLRFQKSPVFDPRGRPGFFVSECGDQVSPASGYETSR